MNDKKNSPGHDSVNRNAVGSPLHAAVIRAQAQRLRDKKQARVLADAHRAALASGRAHRNR